MKKLLSRIAFVALAIGALTGSAIASECGRSSLIRAIHKLLNQGHDHVVIPYAYLGDEDSFGTVLKMAVGENEAAKKALQKELAAEANRVCAGVGASVEDFGDAKTISELMDKLGAT